jgi:hypothetical protein
VAVDSHKTSESAGATGPLTARNSRSNDENFSESCCVACERPITVKSFFKTRYMRIYGCNSCGSWTSLPRPTVESQASLHDTAEYFEHPYFQARRENEALSLGRCRNIFGQIANVMNVDCLRGERMLDIGCDVGSLLVAAAQSYGIQPLGLDVAGRAVHLASGGLFFIQTPNCESIVYQLGWRISQLTNGRPSGSLDRLFPPQHIQYFSQCGLQFLAQRIGFQVVDMQTRILPRSDIVTSVLVRVGLMGLQVIDSLRGKQILLCTVLRKA